MRGRLDDIMGGFSDGKNLCDLWSGPLGLHFCLFDRYSFESSAATRRNSRLLINAAITVHGLLKVDLRSLSLLKHVRALVVDDGLVMLTI